MPVRGHSWDYWKEKLMKEQGYDEETANKIIGSWEQEDKKKSEGEFISSLGEGEIAVEAEYQGKKVTLNKPMRNSDGKSKFKVYVQDGDKVKKVTFGDPNMEIKRDSDERRKSFRARHNCADKKDKTTAGYWSCKMWQKGKSVGAMTGGEADPCWKGYKQFGMKGDPPVPNCIPSKESEIEFDPKELEMGKKVELEHTDDENEAEKIAKDHLKEVPDYYTKLAKYVEDGRDAIEFEGETYISLGENEKTGDNDLELDGKVYAKATDLSTKGKPDDEDSLSTKESIGEGFIKDMGLRKEDLPRYNKESLVNIWRDANAYYQNPYNTWEEEDAEFYTALGELLVSKQNESYSKEEGIASVTGPPAGTEPTVIEEEEALADTRVGGDLGKELGDSVVESHDPILLNDNYIAFENVLYRPVYDGESININDDSILIYENKYYTSEGTGNCPMCKGAGKVTVERLGLKECPKCEGSGDIQEKPEIPQEPPQQKIPTEEIEEEFIDETPEKENMMMSDFINKEEGKEHYDKDGTFWFTTDNGKRIGVKKGQNLEDALSDAGIPNDGKDQSDVTASDLAKKEKKDGNNIKDEEDKNEDRYEKLFGRISQDAKANQDIYSLSNFDPEVHMDGDLLSDLRDAGVTDDEIIDYVNSIDNLDPNKQGDFMKANYGDKKEINVKPEQTRKPKPKKDRKQGERPDGKFYRQPSDNGNKPHITKDYRKDKSEIDGDEWSSMTEQERNQALYAKYGSTNKLGISKYDKLMRNDVLPKEMVSDKQAKDFWDNLDKSDKIGNGLYMVSNYEYDRLTSDEQMAVKERYTDQFKSRKQLYDEFRELKEKYPKKYGMDEHQYVIDTERLLRGKPTRLAWTLDSAKKTKDNTIAVSDSTDFINGSNGQVGGIRENAYEEVFEPIQVEGKDGVWEFGGSYTNEKQMKRLAKMAKKDGVLTKGDVKTLMDEAIIDADPSENKPIAFKLGGKTYWTAPMNLNYESDESFKAKETLVKCNEPNCPNMVNVDDYD